MKIIQSITPISKVCQLYANHQQDFAQILEQSIINTKHYIVPIKRTNYKGTIHLKVIIPAVSPQRAYYLAQEEFEPDNWTVDPDYQNYKTT